MPFSKFLTGWSEKQIISRYKTNYIYHTSYFNRDGIRATGLVKTAAGFIHYFDENGELLKNVAVNVGAQPMSLERGRLARKSFIWDKVDFTFPENVNFIMVMKRATLLRDFKPLMVTNFTSIKTVVKQKFSN